jgi:hypothetical protein
VRERLDHRYTMSLLGAIMLTLTRIAMAADRASCAASGRPISM